MKKSATVLAMLGTIASFDYAIYIYFLTQSLMSSGDGRYSQASVDRFYMISDIHLIVGVSGAIICFLLIRDKSNKLINSVLLIVLGFLPILFFGFSQALFVFPLGIAGGLLFFTKDKVITEA
ncbi:MAG: hypothetical protein DIZ80_15555 [endosymbiont of Galathealinum brachiosum]|uniref:Uncharacterized protein n=1 Tax=endosymbiont of Galathealinum brachiosum TaxID=2200906 RepID=A0A370DAU6_9GAMM|nr:MAG: hypothetical protein DIZ80_15555 [endosymbiont of Galathealinum brachiosum]